MKLGRHVGWYLDSLEHLRDQPCSSVHGATGHSVTQHLGPGLAWGLEWEASREPW